MNILKTVMLPYVLLIFVNCNGNENVNPSSGNTATPPTSENPTVYPTEAKIIFISIDPGGGITVMLNRSNFVDLRFRYSFDNDAVVYFTILAMDRLGNIITPLFPTKTWDVLRGTGSVDFKENVYFSSSYGSKTVNHFQLHLAIGPRFLRGVATSIADRYNLHDLRF